MDTKKILCPTDFGESDREAMSIASGLAERSGAELLVLHVVENPAEPLYGEKSTEGKDLAAWALWKVAKTDVETRLKELVDPKAARVRPLCTFGDPATRIAETVSEEGVDLVVLCGRRRKSMLQGVHLGEVAYKVVRTVGCDVLVVR